MSQLTFRKQQTSNRLFSGEQSIKIEFPCENYPIKIVGEADKNFLNFVLETTEQFDPRINRKNVIVKDSRKGRFISVTLLMTVIGVDQLQAYHKVLKENPATKIVL